jgi:endonuclease/exonuclease/phosphatase (EEP) superfamily protein YafD
VATYNVNYGNADLRGVVQAIRRCGADVVALQETNKQSEDYLRRELTKTYPHMTFHHARAAGGFAILSKAPIEKPGYLPPLRSAGGWCGTQTARVMLQDRELRIVNVHLAATVPQDGMDVKAVTALFLKTEAVREKEIRHIVGQLPKRWPVIVLGDFNSVPGLSRVPGFMAESGFTDCLARVVKDADALPTWRWKVAGKEYSLRLDYIFSARTNAEPVSGRVEAGDASDHSPVVCSFKWTPIPVSLGEVHAQAANVVYLLDAVGMTPERMAAARELVTASMTRLAPAQHLCVAVPGRKEVLVPAELAPATVENRTAALDALPGEAPGEDALLPAVRQAMSVLGDEAAPKALFLLSDRLAKDSRLLASVLALHTDERLQLFLLDGGGKPETRNQKSDSVMKSE